MPAKKTITERSRKADILEAYEELKEKLEGLKKEPSRADVSERAELEPGRKARLEDEPAIEPEQVEAAYGPEGLIRGISSLKVTVANALGELENRLVEESRKLESIRKEITEGRGMLKEAYEIELDAETLTGLTSRQEEEKARLRKEMDETRLEWEHEKKAR